MLILLSSFILSTSIQITPENYDDILNNTKKVPVFLKLWAPWCQFCKEMAPEWEKLAKTENLKDSVIIAEIECQENRELCKKFEGENYPRIYFIDNRHNLTTQYFGTRTNELFQIFIEKQLKFPLIPVKNNKDDLQHYFNMSNLLTTFIFCFPNNDQASLKYARELAFKNRHYESQFLALDTNQNDNSHHYFDLKENETKIIAITGPNSTSELSCSFDDIQIQHFLYSHSIPFMSLFSPAAMKHTSVENNAAMIIVTRSPTKKYNQDIISISKHANDYYPVTTANCVDQQWICLYTSIDTNAAEPQFLIFDRSKRLFWAYRNTNRSIEMVEKWVTDVYNHKVRSEGPGTGFLSLILEPIYDQRASGESVSYVPYIIIPLILIFVISTTCIDFYKEVQGMKANPEQSPSTHEVNHKHSE